MAQLKREPLTIDTAAGTRTFDIEIAETLEQKSIGLMFRRNLAEDSGMLFPYAPEQELTMWMRNTLIPLDMLFVRSDGVIHRIEAWTEPLSERVIPSNGPVTAVLELGGGVAAKLGIKPGDRINHRHFTKPANKKP